MAKKSLIYTLVTALLSGSMSLTLGVPKSVLAEDKQTEYSSQTTRVSLENQENLTEVDKIFITLMVPHHQALIDMSNMALSRSKNPEVKRLAEKMIQEQTKDVNNMLSWYKQWYGTEVPTASETMIIPAKTTQNNLKIAVVQQSMMMKSMMDKMNNVSNFDRAYLDQMIPHHQMGIIMSEFAADSGYHREIRQLGTSDTKSQNQEISQMQQLLSQVSN